MFRTRDQGKSWISRGVIVAWMHGLIPPGALGIFPPTPSYSVARLIQSL